MNIFRFSFSISLQNVRKKGIYCTQETGAGVFAKHFFSMENMGPKGLLLPSFCTFLCKGRPQPIVQ